MVIFNDASFFEKKNSLGEAIAQEHRQFKLHQSVKFQDYVKQRSGFLSKQPHAEASREFIAAFSPKIAVFPGSFNPFHKGHYNVLQKAEKIFDKVIVAFGNNPEKTGERRYKIPTSISNRQVEEYNGLLTDFVNSIGGEEIIVIRGLRNSTDFQYEQNQYRYIQELMPHIKIVNIFCDKEFEHISSSGIRTLEKYNKHQNYLLE
ncbi:MAG: adenylyltransferase/cytidyltransferase family protein [Bacteroidota bacterium]